MRTTRSTPLLLAAFCILACRDQSSPTGPAQNLSGTYLLTTSESCGGVAGSSMVRVIQTGNQVSFLLGVDSGGVQGAIQGDSITLTWTKASDAGLLCGSSLTGTASISGHKITGAVSGSADSRSCFSCPSNTITFTLQQQ
jgi:hypothetical protein